MEKKNSNYTAPQIEVITIEIEQAVLNASSEGWNETEHPF
jgi:hypothetical protein